jgi:hypothetical protein
MGAVAIAAAVVAGAPAFADDRDDDTGDDTTAPKYVLAADGFVATGVAGTAEDAGSFGLGGGIRGERQYDKFAITVRVAAIFYPGKADSGYRHWTTVPFLGGFRFSLGATRRFYVGGEMGGAVNHAAIETMFGKDSELELAFAGAASFGYRRGPLDFRASVISSGVFGAKPGGGIKIEQPSNSLVLSSGYNFRAF